MFTENTTVALQVMQYLYDDLIGLSSKRWRPARRIYTALARTGSGLSYRYEISRNRANQRKWRVIQRESDHPLIVEYESVPISDRRTKLKNRLIWRLLAAAPSRPASLSCRFGELSFNEKDTRSELELHFVRKVP